MINNINYDDYDDILCRWKCDKTKAANELEQMLLNDELPSSGAVARAIVILREDSKPVIHAHWTDLKYAISSDPEDDICCSFCGYPSKRLNDYCPGCGAIMDEDEVMDDDE